MPSCRKQDGHHCRLNARTNTQEKMGIQQFCLRWNNHQSNMLNVFEELLQNEAFVDVTLAADGLSLKAHKMVLSACSPYFQSLFSENPCKHPIVILKDMHYSELRAIVDFMYKGEINVSQEQLPALLKTAEVLKIKGLTEVSSNSVPNISNVNVPCETTLSSSPSISTCPPVVPGRADTMDDDAASLPSSPSNAYQDATPVKRKRHKHKHRPWQNSTDEAELNGVHQQDVNHETTKDTDNAITGAKSEPVDLHTDNSDAPSDLTQVPSQPDSEVQCHNPPTESAEWDGPVSSVPSSSSLPTSCPLPPLPPNQDLSWSRSDPNLACLVALASSGHTLPFHHHLASHLPPPPLPLALPPPPPPLQPPPILQQQLEQHDQELAASKRKWENPTGNDSPLLAMSINQALSEVTAGNMSLNRAAKVFSIPLHTLWRKARKAGIISAFPSRWVRRGTEEQK